MEHESALPHQRLNKYDLFCVGSDSRASAEEQLHILKMLPWSTCAHTVSTGEKKSATLHCICESVVYIKKHTAHA